ncbi:hypothetical protein EOG37_01170 [Clavibacter michiganensis subsp. michiganensis]|uniref:hypothetical protein n=1 Tax=Clavibacter michiganensis TaxID=28447 RepID=UPI001C650A36|nr:hypothetical protein [Clavibacter michiganensis]MBW8025292.1 hypothetical protein [Clavibacter michiganensis subsp. michiganensis]
MADRVIHADLQAFLIPWLAAELDARPEEVCRDVSVRDTEPIAGRPMPKRMVIIRDDSGSTRSTVTAERSIGISVLAGTKESPEDAVDLALIVNALISDVARPEAGNPVARVDDMTGPFYVAEDLPSARRYSTATLVVVGSPF